jgi:PST family polysaccharide transporter
MKKTREYFETGDLEKDLKVRSISGGFVTGTAQIIKFCLNIGSTVILARLLTPADYGLISMVSAIIGFVSLFKDLGLSMATVQRKYIDQNQVSMLFWINVALSILVMLFTATISYAIAGFYKEPRLVGITIALGSAFIFGGITVQHQALLHRKMKFFALALVEVISILVSILIAIAFALYGAGYWSLVMMQVTLAICNAVGVWVACGWRPSRPTMDSNVRSMLNFGGNLTGFNILNYLARNLDHVLIGRAWGSQQLGMYAKAYQMLLMPIQQVSTPITSVAIPTLSSLQNDTNRFRHYYCTALTLIAYITCPLIMIMAALSDEIIFIILGDQWSGAGRIFKVLAFAAFFQPLLNTTGWIYISLGQTYRMMIFSLVTVPACIAAFFIGLPWGAYGVAVSYTLYYLFMVLPNYMYAIKESPIRLIDALKSVWRPIMISLFIHIVITYGKFLFSGFGHIYIVVFSVIISVIIFSVSIFAWPNAKAEAIELIDVIKLIRSRKFTPIRA